MRHELTCLACSAVMLVGTKNGNIKVGEVEESHKDEVLFEFHACISF